MIFGVLIIGRSGYFYLLLCSNISWALYHIHNVKIEFHATQYTPIFANYEYWIEYNQDITTLFIFDFAKNCKMNELSIVGMST